MKNYKNKSIVVFNPVSGYGHLDSWNVLFIKIFLELGYKVDIFSDNAISLARELVRKDFVVSSLLTVHQNSLNVSHENGMEENSVSITYSKDLTKRIALLGVKLQDGDFGYRGVIEFILLGLTHFFKYYIFAYLKKYYKYSMSADNSAQSFDAIESIINDFGLSPDLIFHMYLDILDFNSTKKTNVFSKAKKRWAGLRFSPCENDLAFYQNHPEIKGVCFLDEFWNKYFHLRLKDISYVALPDITSSALPSDRSKLAFQVLARANNRKIIFLGGMIGWRKNIDIWYELVKLADASKWFFVQVGEIIPAGMSASDLVSFYKTMYKIPENLMVIPKYLEDETNFNELISISDIIYAVYRDFPNSSNMLTKAATFCKPIIVSSGHLMAQRVEKYGIGKIVNERDSKRIYEAIEGMPDPTHFSRNFDEYSHDFNEAALKNKLSIFIKSLIQ